MSNMAISTLGCGWLGFPLAKQLVSLGFKVKGSTTTSAKLKVMEGAGIWPFILDVSPQVHGQNIRNFFEADIIFTQDGRHELVRIEGLRAKMKTGISIASDISFGDQRPHHHHTIPIDSDISCGIEDACIPNVRIYFDIPVDKKVA